MGVSKVNIPKAEENHLEQQESPSKANTNCDKSPDNISIDNTIDFIRVVDNINTNKHYLKDSVTIKKELSKISSEKINIKHTYTLSKGGVAFHFNTQEDTNKFEKEVTKIFPGSTCSIPKSIVKKQKKFIRNIDRVISIEKLTSSLQKTILGKFSLRRFYSSRTGTPLPIVCVTCESSICDKILKTGIKLFELHFNCEKYIKPVTRCFNCQLFGHISINCLNKHRCENCGKNHYPLHYYHHCSQSPFCVNCNKPGHPSSSRECPKYIEKKTIISHEITPVKYYFI